LIPEEDIPEWLRGNNINSETYEIKKDEISTVEFNQNNLYYKVDYNNISLENIFDLI
jgi:outer membrane biogenesis lipoprotein LolB